MEIPNVSVFARLISEIGLAERHPTFQQIVHCLNNYSAACNCYKREDKLNMYATCNQLYRQAALHVVPLLKNEFFAKITDRQLIFKNDAGQVMVIVCR